MAVTCGFSQVLIVFVLIPYKAAISEMVYGFTMVWGISFIATGFVAELDELFREIHKRKHIEKQKFC